MPESDIKVVTPLDVMLGKVSFFEIASAKFLFFPAHDGNKTNITAAKNAAVMFIYVKYVFLC